MNSARVCCLGMLLLLSPAWLWGDEPGRDEPAGEARKFVSVIRVEDVRPHIEHLASDQFKGRSGEDALAAADYLRTHFKRLGLKPLLFKSNDWREKVGLEEQG